MKKYLFGLFAVVLAVAFSAFKPAVTNLYEFSGDQITADLLDENKWSATLTSCSGFGSKTCQFDMPVNITDKSQIPAYLQNELSNVYGSDQSAFEAGILSRSHDVRQ
jgi:hypothetical protein